MPSVSRRMILVLSVFLTLSLAAVACSDGETPFATVAPTTDTGGQQPTTAPADNGDGGGDAANGQALFTSNGCSACHSTGTDTVVGPGLSGVSQRGDDEYLTESIRNPGAVVAEGFAPLMPAFPALSDANVADLVAYLNTLN